jgi:peroxiredoxin
MKTGIIAAVAALAVAAYPVFKPAAAPQVHFATLAGNTFATSDLRGKVVLVNFWATWCADCIKEMPKMIETHRKYAPRGYEMVAVAVQSDNPQQVAAFARRRALPFRVAHDASGEVAKSFGHVRITPVSVLIDRQGNIVKRYVGEPDWAELHATVEKLLD